jgi:putative peptidoglycan lipid II flippase
VTLLLAISSFLSRLLGVYRNHELASLFGATPLSDAYFAAFQIPDTLYRLLVFGAISASFVPLFLTLRKKEDESHDPELRSWQFVSSILNGFLLVMLILCFFAFIFSNELVEFLYPSFSNSLQQTTTQLLRIMLLSPIFFTFSSLFSGIQNAFRSFWGFAFAPIVYNLGILFGIFVLSPSFGIHGVAYGVVIGAFLHAAVQGIPCIKLGFNWHPVLIWDKWFKQLIITGIPRILTLAGFQLNFFIEGLIASSLSIGSLTVLRYAQDIQSFPIGIIGVSVALTSFSILTHFVIDGKPAELAQHIEEKISHILFLTIPCAFGLFALRIPIVSLILKGGIFDAHAVQMTSSVLGYLCIGLVAAALYPLIARVFFAFHDTIRPLFITIIMVIFNTFLALFFSQTIGISGVGLASAISTTLALVIAIALLRNRYLSHAPCVPFSSIFLYSTSGGFMYFILSQLISSINFPHDIVLLLLQLIVFIVFGAFVYALCIYLFLRKKMFSLLKDIFQ